jgi:hypothetical protein
MTKKKDKEEVEVFVIRESVEYDGDIGEVSVVTEEHIKDYIEKIRSNFKNENGQILLLKRMKDNSWGDHIIFKHKYYGHHGGIYTTIYRITKHKLNEIKLN